MADLDFNHTAELIKAAIPYVDSKTKGLVELVAKSMDLLGSLKSADNNNILSTLDFHSIKIDVEGLLKGIRPICNHKEQEIVDRILNIFNMKRMFEMYNNVMSAMKNMQDVGGFDFGDSGGGNDAENVASNFTGSNFDSIFQNFSNSSSADNTQKTSDKNDTESYYNPFNTSDYKATEETPAQDPIKNAEAKNTSSSNPMNNKMFDMLKAMVPPEQMSTFENLSMLLNTMSYDNNSKQDENKE